MKKGLWVLTIGLALLFTFQHGAGLRTALCAEQRVGVRVQWFGQAFFLLTDTGGTRIAIDPFAPSVGYPVPDISADAVLVTHDHLDHNNVGIIGGNPKTIRGLGAAQVKGVHIRGVPTYHDKFGGARRGPNTVFVVRLGGLRIAHLGDLGHVLTNDQVREVGPVDVLLIPVGGNFTIDAREAAQVVRQLNPRIVIPMHYRTAAVSLPIQPVTAFLEGKDNIDKPGKNVLHIDPASLPEETRIVVMNYK